MGVAVASAGPYANHCTSLQTDNHASTSLLSFCRLDVLPATKATRMWANAQRDGRPAEYRWRPLFNAAKFG